MNEEDVKKFEKMKLIELLITLFIFGKKESHKKI